MDEGLCSPQRSTPHDWVLCLVHWRQIRRADQAFCYLLGRQRGTSGLHAQNNVMPDLEAIAVPSGKTLQVQHLPHNCPS